MKSNLSTIICKLLFIAAFMAVIYSCKSAGVDKSDIQASFLKADANAEELFHVLIISDRYESSQMKFNEQMKRLDDDEGNRNICTKLKDYDKINETCEAVLTIWLYPDSGRIMKIRPKALAQISEVNSLIVEDAKRWNFSFKDDEIEPKVFDIKYRVVLRKLQSDEDIMKEVREKQKDSKGSVD
jgi:hypothetical protein